MSKFNKQTYILKIRGGLEFDIQAKNLLDLHSQINLTFMNELGYYLDDFISIELKKPNMISVCEECRTQEFTMETKEGNPITNHAGKDAYCFKCDDFAHVIEIEEVVNG